MLYPESVQRSIRTNIFGMFLCFIESVQRSLERKFGKNGGAIPILPTEDFEKRIAVSNPQ